MMGESETVKSGARLEVSVSFGRYEGHALSWEKWSSFSPNKYLEEVGNLSTPGSVAEKAAYFEAHYRKIAARRAEELEQGQLMGSDARGSDDDCVGDPHTYAELELPSGDGFVEALEEASGSIGDIDGGTIDDSFGCRTEGVEQEAQTTMKVFDAEGGEKSTAIADEKANYGTVVKALELDVGLEAGIEDSAKEKANYGSVVKALELDVGLEADLFGVEVEDSAKDVSQQIAANASEREESSTMKRGNAKEVAQKVTPNKKERGVPSAFEPSPSPNPRKVKAKSISTPRSLQEKGSGSLIPKGKNFRVGESKRAAQSSLHMPISLGPALSVTRKSLIMEKPRDKNIVRRAFKTSHNRTSRSSTDESSSAPKQLSQVPSITSAPKRSTPLTQARGRTGLRRDSEKIATQRNNQSQSRLKPLPSGSYRSSEKKNSIAISPSVALRSDERAEKRKEFLKKLEAKSIARGDEDAQLRAKSKEEKESEIRKLRQNLNFKAKPLPSFYRDQREKDK